MDKRNVNSSSENSHNIRRWKRALAQTENIQDNIEKIKIEANLLQEKAKQKEFLLKNERNSYDIAKREKLNNEISNLYLNSIQAKLQILNKINSN